MARYRYATLSLVAVCVAASSIFATLARALCSYFDRAARAVFDFVAEACPHAMTELGLRFSTFVRAATGDARLLPAYRSHGGLGLALQHNAHANRYPVGLRLAC